MAVSSPAARAVEQAMRSEVGRIWASGDHSRGWSERLLHDTAQRPSAAEFDAFAYGGV